MLRQVRASVCLLLCAAALAACSGEISDHSSERQPSDFQGNGAVASASIKLVLGSAGGYQTPQGAVQWPLDSMPHPTQRAESWQLMALLEDADGVRYSVLQQFDRIGLRDADALDTSEQGSDWRFRDVMRGSLHVLSEVEPRRDWQSLQRVAIGLAAAQGTVEDSKEAQVNVGSNRLEIEVMHDEEDDRCAMRFQMTMLDSIQLEFNQQQCAESNAAGPLRVVTSPSLPVEGEISVGRSVQGIGWVRHAFGELPGTGSPVVFDNALLEIEGVGLLVVSRSKRRSGRGPETLEAHLHGEPVKRLKDLVWGSDEPETRAEPILSRWRVKSASNQLNVMLEPVSGDAWVDGPLGSIWRGAVSVSGSHVGVGFVDFQSVVNAHASD